MVDEQRRTSGLCRISALGLKRRAASQSTLRPREIVAGRTAPSQLCSLERKREREREEENLCRHLSPSSTACDGDGQLEGEQQHLRLRAAPAPCARPREPSRSDISHSVDTHLDASTQPPLQPSTPFAYMSLDPISSPYLAEQASKIRAKPVPWDVGHADSCSRLALPPLSDAPLRSLARPSSLPLAGLPAGLAHHDVRARPAQEGRPAPGR